MLVNQLLKATVLSLVVTISTIPNVFASSNYGAMRTTHIMDTGAYPAHRKEFVTHEFELHIAGKELNEMLISLPNGISEIQTIEITDDSGNIIKNNVSWQDKDGIITFDKPIHTDTILLVKFKGVKINNPSNIFLYHLSIKIAGITDFIPLGAIRIQSSYK